MLNQRSVSSAELTSSGSDEPVKQNAVKFFERFTERKTGPRLVVQFINTSNSAEQDFSNQRRMNIPERTLANTIFDNILKKLHPFFLMPCKHLFGRKVCSDVFNKVRAGFPHLGNTRVKIVFDSLAGLLVFQSTLPASMTNSFQQAIQSNQKQLFLAWRNIIKRSIRALDPFCKLVHGEVTKPFLQKYFFNLITYFFSPVTSRFGSANSGSTRFFYRHHPILFSTTRGIITSITTQHGRTALS